ncbi:TPA: hypothetical protein ACH3X1_000018 [Trebouxia sp. C0004]
MVKNPNPMPVQCSTFKGKIQSPLLSAAVQSRLTAGLCHCNHTYEDLLIIQVCSDPPPMHGSSFQCKMQSPIFSAVLQDRLTAGLCSWDHTYGRLLHCSTFKGKIHSPLLSAAL